MTVLLLVAVGGRVVGYLRDAVDGRYAAEAILPIIGLRLPEFVQLVLPFSYYIALLLTLGRLHTDSEMVVLQNSGMSTSRLLAWLSGTSLLVVASVTALSLYITPDASRRLEERIAEMDAAELFHQLVPGVFARSSDGSRVLYAAGMTEDKSELQQVFVWESTDTNQDITTWAASGRQYTDEHTGSQFLVLTDGVRYEGKPGEATFRKVQFEVLSQRVASRSAADPRTRLSALPTSALPITAPGRAEWHWRMSLPLFAAISSLLAIGLSRVPPRAGRFASIIPGLAIFLSYYFVMLGNHALVERGLVSGFIGMWPTHAGFLLLAGHRLRKLSHPNT